MSELNEQAKKAIKELGELPDPNRDPLLQLVELLLVEDGELSPPPQVDLSDQDWERFLLHEDVEKVLKKLIKSEHLELPESLEQKKVWAGNLVELALEEFPV